MRASITLIIFLLSSYCVFCQSYTSYFTGSEVDKTVSNQEFSLTVMGGGGEVDYAMKMFLEDANGGDVLVLRTSGSDGYNDYMYSELGVELNSVETIVCHNQDASSDPYVLERILRAEAVWFANGDQWEYLSYWRDTPLQQYINFAILDKGMPVGGTGAGMAIMGQYQFTAENGTVTSEQALADPYNEKMTIDNRPFLFMPLPIPIIFDSHFDNPDRRGRLVAFMARIRQDYNEHVVGIGLDEYTAARLKGFEMVMVNDAFEDQEDFTHTYSYDCSVEPLDFIVELEMPLTWDGDHIKYRKFRSTPSPIAFIKLNSNSVNFLPDEDHAINIVNGDYQISIESDLEYPVPCNLLSSVDEENLSDMSLYPNPTRNSLEVFVGGREIEELSVISVNGKKTDLASSHLINNILDVSNLSTGIYILKAIIGKERIFRMFVKL